MSARVGPRRGEWINVLEHELDPLPEEELEAWEGLDLVYRSLCAILYNYAPSSGHPGGSISSGRIVQNLLFRTMEYDLSRPDRPDADAIVYAAGHKALGLYALWALRDEVARFTARELLPGEPRRRLRLEDLLGFRRNPTHRTPLFLEFGSKPLDGHPTPATPFVPLATGASGVGMGSALGLALALADTWGEDAPRVHVIEGEGGLTPGRVVEALAFASAASLDNAVVHVDWNQSSIDSDRVCREGDRPGDYVQWTPGELFHLHDWNVVEVPDGFDHRQVATAQRLALAFDNGRPTAVVYRTTKGWRYGIEGRGSHGAGHRLCSSAFHEALSPLLSSGPGGVPVCEPGSTLCHDGSDRAQVERCYWLALSHVRRVLLENPGLMERFGGRLRDSRSRLDSRLRRPRPDAPRVEDLFEAAAAADPARPPEELRPAPGSSIPLRKQLGRVLGWLNRSSGGALLVGSADLLDSTAVSEAVRGFPEGWFDRRANPGSRTLSVGGIAEDGMAAVLSGLSSYGRHVGVGSSYGAFIAPLSHVASRLHAIGNQARRGVDGGPYRPWIVVCGHAGLKTGEDGPTHADPQALQLLQDNFPPGTMITLTPWEPGELWPLLVTALAARPAVVAPFVTRPSEPVLDREALGLAPAAEAVQGLYRLRAARGEHDGTVVLQGSGVAYAFVNRALPLLDREGVDVDAWYVASSELFDALSDDVRACIFPEERAREAMGITGFTLPTLYRWVTGETGRRHSLHPFRTGHYPGSGPGPDVIREAGLDGEGQFRAIMAYCEERARRGVLV